MIMRESKQDQKSGRAVIAMLLTVGLCSASCAVETDASGAASQFAKEATKKKYKETDPPSAAALFRWDFSKAHVVHAYDYEQEVWKKTYKEQKMSTKGTLLIKSQGDSTAELVLKEMKMSMEIMDMRKGEPRTIEEHIPSSVVQGMKKDGSGSFGNSSQGMILKMLFPLPPKVLKVGESVDVPAQMPFNAMGSMLQVTGNSRITLTRYVKIGKNTCAQLNVDTDISQLKVPPELKGEYKYSTKGTSVFYFDVANRSFVSGTIVLLIQFSIDAPMPQMKISGGDAPDMPKRYKMSMKSDNLIRVKLKE